MRKLKISLWSSDDKEKEAVVNDARASMLTYRIAAAPPHFGADSKFLTTSQQQSQSKNASLIWSRLLFEQCSLLAASYRFMHDQEHCAVFCPTRKVAEAKAKIEKFARDSLQFERAKDEPQLASLPRTLVELAIYSAVGSTLPTLNWHRLGDSLFVYSTKSYPLVGDGQQDLVEPSSSSSSSSSSFSSSFSSLSPLGALQQLPGVKLALNFSDGAAYLSASAVVAGLRPLNLAQRIGASIRARQEMSERGFVQGGALSDSVCYVMPRVSPGRIVSVLRVADGDIEQQAMVDELRIYWKTVHGVTLSPTIDAIVSVRFQSGSKFDYPSCAVVGSALQLNPTLPPVKRDTIERNFVDAIGQVPCFDASAPATLVRDVGFKSAASSMAAPSLTKRLRIT
jgi:Domain of unknown function (DUF4708)